MTEADTAAAAVATQEPIIAEVVEDMAVMRAEITRLTAAEEDLKALCAKYKTALSDLQQYAQAALSDSPRSAEGAATS